MIEIAAAALELTTIFTGKAAGISPKFSRTDSISVGYFDKKIFLRIDFYSEKKIGT